IGVDEPRIGGNPCFGIVFEPLDDYSSLSATLETKVQNTNGGTTQYVCAFLKPCIPIRIRLTLHSIERDDTNAVVIAISRNGKMIGFLELFLIVIGFTL